MGTPNFYFLKTKLKSPLLGVPAAVHWAKNPAALARVTVEVQVPPLAQHSGLKDQAQVAATAGIQTLAWELPYAAGAATKKRKAHLLSSAVFQTSVHLGTLASRLAVGSLSLAP